MESTLVEAVDVACNPWIPGIAGGLSTWLHMELTLQDHDSLAGESLKYPACRY